MLSQDDHLNHPVQTSSIFVSYRRQDSKLIAERLHERLAAAFGSEHVFFDIEDIPPGTDFPTHLKQQLETCSLVLVVVGDQWTDARDAEGNRRLENPDDFVRQEIEWANGQGVTVLPVLVDGAQMPDESELPPSLKFFARRNAMEVRSGADFDFTSMRLIEQLGAAHGLKRKDKKIRWEIPLLCVGIFMALGSGGIAMSRFVVSPSGYSPWFASDLLQANIGWEISGPFFLGLSSVTIGLSRWMCCIRSARNRTAFGNALFAAKRKSPKAMICFVAGLASIGWGLISAPVAFIMAILGWLQIRRQPSLFHGRRYILIGVALAIIGSIVSTYGQYVAWAPYGTFQAMDEAQALIDQDKLDEAEPIVRQAIESMPMLTRPYYLSGQLFLKQGKYPQAVEHLNIAIGDLDKQQTNTLAFDSPMMGNLRFEHLKNSLKLISEAYLAMGNVESSEYALNYMRGLNQPMSGRAKATDYRTKE